MVGGEESDQSWKKWKKNKLKEKSACSDGCYWQRQTDPLTKNVWEKEWTRRPQRPPRSSSHKLCVCLRVCVILMTDCLCLYGVKAGFKKVLNLPRYHHSSAHTHPKAQKPSLFLSIYLYNTAEESHNKRLWKWFWWVANTGSHPSLNSCGMLSLFSYPLFILIHTILY